MVYSSLAECLTEKFGYDNVEALKEDGKSRFSLVESGILDKPCTRLLLANVSCHTSSGASYRKLIRLIGNE